MRLTAGLLAIVIAGSMLAQDRDVMLQAMRDELERSKTLRIQSSDPTTSPYFIEYSVEDADMLMITASLGGLISMSRSTARLPT
ncbi:MAG: hypothetical protein JO022_01045, partial [Acidobacteriaceae bacterium]|nr:hypothetical protein [Acidobacteriaceae bacterium]